MAVRQICRCLCLVLLLGCTEGAGPAPPPIERVVLISIDTLRPDRTGVYDERRATTPSLDRLAAESVVFRRAFSSNPMTLPSHATMLTGLDPTSHGIHDNGIYRLDDVHETLAERFAQAGWRTGAVLGATVLDARHGLGQGFEVWDDDFSNGRLSGSAGYLQRTATEVTDRAIELVALHRGEPFFLFVHYYDPHHAWSAPSAYEARFDGDGYAAEIAYTDAEIGRLLEDLQRDGTYANTLVVVTSDHGDSFGEHRESWHSFFIYPTTQHVPLIVRRPGRGARRDVGATVGVVDIAPTILSLAGLPPSPSDGVDLSPLLEDDVPAEWPERHVYAESFYPTKLRCNPLFAVFSDRWQLIDTLRPELYDLDADPGATRDLIDRETAVAANLRLELDRLRSGDSASAPRPELDAEAAAALVALGYLAGDVDDSVRIDASLDDPKDCIDLYSDLLDLGALIERRELLKARETARRILARRPETREVYRYLGQIAAEERKWSESISHFRLYVALTEAEMRKSSDLGDAERRWLAESYTAIGVANGQLKRFDAAIEAFDSAIAADAGLTRAHYNLGYAHLSAGRTKAARTAFEATLELDPDHGNARRQLDALEAK